MSQTRRSRGGWAGKLPKGPNGRNLCRQCGTEVPIGRQTFCSKQCVHDWRIRTDPNYVRQAVFERDNGICALCHVDVFENAFHRNGSARRRKARGSGDLWQADHITPVIEGGGECGIDNLRTLCTACHRRETAALRKRLAENRKMSKPLPLLDQEQLIPW